MNLAPIGLHGTGAGKGAINRVAASVFWRPPERRIRAPVGIWALVSEWALDSAIVMSAGGKDSGRRVGLQFSTFYTLTRLRSLFWLKVRGVTHFRRIHQTP